MTYQVFKERRKLENPNETISLKRAYGSCISLWLKYLCCDGVQVLFAEQAENAAIGEQADFSFIQLLSFQAVSDISK